MMEETSLQCRDQGASLSQLTSLITKVIAKVSLIEADTAYLRKGLAALVSHEPQPLQPSPSPAAQLPPFLAPGLRRNHAASALFVATLRRVGRYIGVNMTQADKLDPLISQYEGWRWHHLYRALIQLRLISPSTTKKAFSKFISDVVPDKKEANVRKGFYRTYGTSPAVIDDIKLEFQPVVSMLQDVA